MVIIVLIIKISLCFLTFGHMAFSADSAPAPNYFEALLEGKDVKVDCSNILSFVQSYLDLSEKNLSLVDVSFKRFVSAIASDQEKSKEEMEKLKEDVSRSGRFMEDSQLVLSEKVGIIMEILPGCLKTNSQ